MKKIAVFTLLFVTFWTAGANARRLAVHTGKANVRSGPGTKHEILWSAGKYYPVDIIKQSGNWVIIKYNIITY